MCRSPIHRPRTTCSFSVPSFRWSCKPRQVGRFCGSQESQEVGQDIRISYKSLVWPIFWGFKKAYPWIPVDFFPCFLSISRFFLRRKTISCVERCMNLTVFGSDFEVIPCEKRIMFQPFWTSGFHVIIPLPISSLKWGNTSAPPEFTGGYVINLEVFRFPLGLGGKVVITQFHHPLGSTSGVV